MKKCMILFALLMGCLWAKAQSVVPQVNENVELMSILSRMAGFREYHMDMAGQYIKDMDRYFKDNTDHPAVGYMQTLRNRYGISFDAVMSMAIHLDNRNGTLSLIEEDVPTLDKRWMEVDKGEFLSHLNNFYKETKFNAFFKAHKSLYEKGIKSYQDNVINHFDIDWYPRFYGKLDKAYKPEEIRNELLEQMQRNFRWMPELVNVLRKYEKKQAKYSNFENFYPNVISFFKEYAQKENDRFEAIK